jgi:hypothetical protein
LPFLLKVGSTSFLVIKDPMEVCLLFVAADVSNRIFAITAKRLLFPLSFTRHSVGSPYGLLSLSCDKENVGLTLFRLTEQKMG